MDETAKLAALKTQTLYPVLKKADQRFLLFLYYTLRLTFQEFNQLVLAVRDLEMWEEKSLSSWCRRRWPAFFACSRWNWESRDNRDNAAKERKLEQIRTICAESGPKTKDHFLTACRQWFEQVKTGEKVYPGSGRPVAVAGLAGLKRPRARIVLKETGKKISGLCPVAAQETSCCRLYTIDAVECCAYGCSYCIIQTFYGREIVFDRHFADKLAALTIEADRFYHFGSGQASDSLYWGNRYGVLAALLGFARQHPDILLELKTKSTNIAYLLRHETPLNVVCSWSLNAPAIIRHEEHGTPSLSARLKAARRLADRGIKVAFHFHPLFLYQGWEEEYGRTARLVQELFRPEEILFISFGTLTLIKPAIQAIRMSGGKSKVLQMPWAFDPKGKLTYPDEIKIRLFRHMYRLFQTWHDEVYFYLCMEKKNIWQEVFAFTYATNAEFEEDFGRQVMRKIRP